MDEDDRHIRREEYYDDYVAEDEDFDSREEDDDEYMQPEEREEPEESEERVDPRTAVRGFLGVKNGKLMTRSSVVFPNLCFKCGAPGSKRYKKTLAWISPFMYLAFFLGIIPLLFIYMMVRKTAVITFSLCPEHISAKNRRGGIIALIGLAMMGSLVAAVVLKAGILGLVGLGLLIVLLIVAVATPSTISLTNVSYDVYTIKGAGPGFRKRIKTFRKKIKLGRPRRGLQRGH